MRKRIIIALLVIMVFTVGFWQADISLAKKGGMKGAIEKIVKKIKIKREKARVDDAPKHTAIKLGGRKKNGWIEKALIEDLPLYTAINHGGKKLGEKIIEGKNPDDSPEHTAIDAGGG